MPVINTKHLEHGALENICKCLNEILDKELPSLPNQLGEDYRIELDVSVMKAIGVEKPENAAIKIHELLRDFFDNVFR